MDSELRDEIEQIIEDMRSYKEQRAEAQRHIDDIDEEIEELIKSKQPFEDQIEGFDDDISGAEKSFMQLLREATDLEEDPADYARRALSRF